MKNKILNWVIISLQAITLFYLLNALITQSEIMMRAAVSLILIMFPYALILLKRKLPLLIEFIYVVFVFLGSFLGSTIMLYSQYIWYDDLVHFISGFVIVTIGHYLFFALDSKMHTKLSPAMMAFIVFLFAASAASIWEIVEFTIDQTIQGMSMQVDLTDTMIDLILGTLSALIASLIGYFYAKTKKPKFLNKLIKEIKNEQNTNKL